MSRKILFVGGGTGGHIAPLFVVMAAVQEEAQKQNIAVECGYVGSEGDLHSSFVQEARLPFKRYAIHSGKFHRYPTFRQIKEVGGLARGFIDARSLMKEIAPDVIFSKGGSVSVPMALAAFRRKIPFYSHETDVIPGLANRLIARHAKRVFTAYPIKNYQGIKQDVLEYVGQPVREEFRSVSASAELILDTRNLASDLPVVTIIGGSQGARSLNETIAKAWPELLKEAQVVHIVGPANQSQLEQQRETLTGSLRERLWVVPFVSAELPLLFAKSALVISRAGGTIAELAAAHKAAILIPLPSAAQHHQQANAQILENAEAAIVLEQIKMTPQKLTQTVFALLNDPARRKNLEENIAQFDRPDAATIIATTLLASK